MHSQASHLFGIASLSPRGARFGALLVLAVATAWSAGAKPPEKPEAGATKGIPYEGLSAERLKALVGTEVDIVPRSGKMFKFAELVQATPGKQPGTLQSIGFKAAEGGAKRSLPAKNLARLVDGNRVYEVIPDRRQKNAFLLVDMEKRDLLVNARLKTMGRFALWPKLSAEAQSKALEENKEFLKKVDDAIPNRKFQLHETPYYLFYADIPETNVAPIIALLDKLYLTLGRALGVYEGENIWHGKAMIVVFSTQDLFARFEKEVMDNPVTETFQSLHHAMNGGNVLTASALGDDANEFATLLVQDTARGYLYRYRSNVYPPSWVREGLAAWAAASVLTSDRSIRSRQQRDAETVRSLGNLAGFLDAEHSNAGWQWGVAAGLTDILLKTDAQAYRGLIQGIKEGQTWKEALEDAYGLSRADLVRLYGQQIGAPNLRP